jgi:hypothetical protein
MCFYIIVKNNVIVEKIKNMIFIWGGGISQCFGWEANQMAHCKKNHQNMHPQLINMDLQEGMVIKVYNKKFVK